MTPVQQTEAEVRQYPAPVDRVREELERVEAPEVHPPGLLRRLFLRESPRRVKVSSALRLYHELLGLEHLHYGLWNGEPLDLEGLKIAQERFSGELCSRIPSGVQSVLDIGCGIGATARILDARGYEVEGLSPDPYHRSLFLRRVGRPFHLARFQEFEPGRRYDLLLMSESSQYIWLDRLFPAVLDAAAPGGHLLIADYFTVNGSRGPLGKSGHPLQRFLRLAEESGLELELKEDITDRVAPTLELAEHWFERFVEPVLSVASDTVTHRHPVLAWMARKLFRRRLAKLADMRQLIDSREFRHQKRYLILRFRVRPPA